MDPEERDALFQNTVSQFLGSEEDANWFFKNVRERVKNEFPDIRPVPRTTDEDYQLEDSRWRDVKVIHCSRRLLTI